LRSDRERLFDILEAAERIEEQAARGRAAFADDAIVGYVDSDVDLVWSVAQNDLPKLGAQIRAILGEMS
jgi:uncharacterized protein with HEPN domain